jgi:hypothetical protein
MLVKNGRTTAENCTDCLWLGVATLAIVIIGGALNALRAFLYKLAYESLK